MLNSPFLKLAHQHDDKVRTKDIKLDEQTTFKDLSLTENVLKGLTLFGFEKPSPIQIAAIPHGRCGLDLVVQAKSGTGKTCVFTIIALESIDITVPKPQVIALAPTREIALQIHEVFVAIGQDIAGFKCHSCIGGLPLQTDIQQVKKSHIIIGTPGRVKQLMELKAMSTDSVRLFILDEADKLMDDNFQQQINWIYAGLPESKQVVAASATYSETLVKHFCNYMQNPTFIRLNSSDPVLIGVRQYRKVVQDVDYPNAAYNNKVKEVIKILSQANFQQCLIFSNLQTRAENLSKLLNSRGWPAAHIAGCQEQSTRIEAMTKLKSYKCRILISTDLTSRGIDADRIDLVVNLDLPIDCETYLHRVGRAGRFGSNGAAVSLVIPTEVERLNQIEKQIKTCIAVLPDTLPADFIQNPQKLRSNQNIVKVESFQVVNDGNVNTRNGDEYSETVDISDILNSETGYASDTLECHQVQGNFGYSPHLMNIEDVHHLSTCNQTTMQLSYTSSNLIPPIIDNMSQNLFEVLQSHSDFMTQPSILQVEQHQPPFQSLAEVRRFMRDPEAAVANLQHVEYASNTTLKDACQNMKKYLLDIEILNKLKELKMDEYKITRQIYSSAPPLKKPPPCTSASVATQAGNGACTTKNSSRSQLQVSKISMSKNEQFWQDFAENYSKGTTAHQCSQTLGTPKQLQKSSQQQESHLTISLDENSFHRMPKESDCVAFPDYRLNNLTRSLAVHYQKIYCMQAYLSKMTTPLNKP